ncbi:oxalate:formate antiporter [Plakobranchus ocellatus]|uniref:Oxalate:formate antiporter n=1 Tax=Plakobranchus ocellatus TaxID=259542 RepID=A0AAV3YMW9_9GAST|nr:oxalate:formate antiporter [Plakobranchus ocellatus]
MDLNTLRIKKSKDLTLFEMIQTFDLINSNDDVESHSQTTAGDIDFTLNNQPATCSDHPNAESSHATKALARRSLRSSCCGQDYVH